MKTPPDLPMCSDLAREAFHRLLKMTSGSSIRTSTVMDNLGKHLGVGHVEVKEVVRELYQAQLLSYTPDRQQLPVSGLIKFTRPQKETLAYQHMWLDALAGSGLSDTAKDALYDLHPKISDMGESDMRVLAAAFARLENEKRSSITEAGFNFSARNIMGGSKVLANLAPKMLQALGLPLRLHTSSPRYVICAGPREPESTLLIENPRAFENALRSGLGQSVALVCTYGFGLSYLGQVWGEDAIEEDTPIQVVRAGNPPSLRSLLQAKKVYLWADFDLAAFNIFRSLKASVPHLKLSGIYECMAELAQNQHGSHPYAILFEKDGQTVSSVSAITFDDPDETVLWNLCQVRAVDQEAVPEKLIAKLGKS